MKPSGTKSTPFELVGAAKTDTGVWNQDKFASGSQVLLGSTISGHTGTVVFTRPLSWAFNGADMSMKVGASYNLALSWAVMYPS
jgi:hypothetical protein